MSEVILRIGFNLNWFLLCIWSFCLIFYRFPLEMHMVHYDRQFKKLEDASKVSQGLAVLAVLFYVS
jgi:hypothetical protein